MAAIYIHILLVQIASALKMFSGVETKEGKKCSVVSCWNILKEEVKWKAKRIELVEQEKQAATGKKTKKNPPRLTNNDHEKEATDATAAVETRGRKRSDGVKKVKENLRRGGGEACLEALDKMWVKKEVANNEKEKTK